MLWSTRQGWLTQPSNWPIYAGRNEIPPTKQEDEYDVGQCRYLAQGSEGERGRRRRDRRRRDRRDQRRRVQSRRHVLRDRQRLYARVRPPFGRLDRRRGGRVP